MIITTTLFNTNDANPYTRGNLFLPRPAGIILQAISGQSPFATNKRLRLWAQNSPLNDGPDNSPGDIPLLDKHLTNHRKSSDIFFFPICQHPIPDHYRWVMVELEHDPGTTQFLQVGIVTED